MASSRSQSPLPRVTLHPRLGRHAGECLSAHATMLIRILYFLLATSATIVAAYLMRATGQEAEQVLAEVRW